MAGKNPTLCTTCHLTLKNAGKCWEEENRSESTFYLCSPEQGDEGKALCKDCCKPIIVTVCNNTEVIHQLLSAVHSWTLIEEQVNGRIQQSQSVFLFCLLSPILLPCSPFGCLILITVQDSVDVFPLNSVPTASSILTAFLPAASFYSAAVGSADCFIILTQLPH